MDWSKAKTILILAFLVLNLFLANQLLQARTEQSRNDQATNTREELNELIEDRQITIMNQVSDETPQVDYLQVRPVKYREPWKANPDGSWTRTFDPPVTASGDRRKILSRYVKKLDDYVLHTGQSGKERQVYYQQWGKRPIYDAKLIAEWRGDDRLASIRQSRFTVSSQKGPDRPGVTAATALVSLIEKGQIQQGTTVTEIRLGYHGRSYDGEIQVLQPVWRILTQDRTYYVNAFNGAIETDRPR